MEKKSVAASFLVIILALIFSVVGICFSTFVYKDTKIVVQGIKIQTISTVEVFEDKDLKKKIDALKLSDMELGLKPATGELDEKTQIPSTITDDDASEGYFSKIYVKATSDFKLVIKNVEIETKKDQIAADEQKKNIFFSLKGRENTTKSLEKPVVEIATFENVSDTLELTILVWLASIATDDLEGAKISFTLDFVAK